MNYTQDLPLHPPTSLKFHDDSIVSADGDIVDLAGDVFLLPFTEFSHFAKFIGQPDKKAACLCRGNLSYTVEIFHKGLDAGCFLTRKERPVLPSPATTRTGIILNGTDTGLQFHITIVKQGC